MPLAAISTSEFLRDFSQVCHEPAARHHRGGRLVSQRETFGIGLSAWPTVGSMTADPTEWSAIVAGRKSYGESRLESKEVTE